MSRTATAPTALLPRLLAGDRAAIARVISVLEQGAPGTAELTAGIGAHLGHAHVIGITGAPGAGKSTLIHALLGELLARGRRIGVVAVDPSSPITGGAVLGDRVRMGEHGAHPDVFIRSVASRGHMGGLSRSTGQIVDVLDAAGFDTVIVETVGAGQSEVEIMRIADTRVVACPPGLGDDVQAIKAGILEIADVLVVTKADLPGAEATARELKDMLHLRRPAAWTVPVLRTVGTKGEGIASLVDQADAHCKATGRAKRLAARPAAATETSSDALVKRLAAADPFVQSLGIACVDAGPGRARVTLTLRDEHLNFNGSCHGGVIFSLADTAFGLAANSRKHIAAGIDAHITYHVAAKGGETLTATAEELSRSRKLAVYRVEVRRGDGQMVSGFTGTVYISTASHG